MKTATDSSKKFFPQKGQGLVEYALLFGFVGAIFLFVFANGGFGNTLGNLFDSAGDNVTTAGNNLLAVNEADRHALCRAD